MGRSQSSNAVKNKPLKMTVLHVDHKRYAREAGKKAYREARADGLSEEVAQKLKKTFGVPIEPEFRLS
jgi:hypothetical protein